jgi:hypothetical protein
LQQNRQRILSQSFFFFLIIFSVKSVPPLIGGVFWVLFLGLGFGFSLGLGKIWGFSGKFA